MKPVHRRVLWICVALSFLVAIVLTVKLIWFKPFSINHFFERAYYEMLLEDPESLSRSQLLEGVPFLDQSSKLTDASTAQDLRMHELGNRLLSILEGYDHDNLNEIDRSSYDVFHWFLKRNVEGEKFLFYNYPLNQFSGAHLAFQSFMVRTHKIGSKKDAEDYLSRLEGWTAKVSELIQAMEHRRELGVIPPTSIIRTVKEQCQEIVLQPVDDDQLYTSFLAKLNQGVGISKDDSIQLVQECRRLVFEEVHPAYRELIDYLNLLQKSSTEVHGVWHLDQGKSFYRHALKSSTTLDISPDELYHMGIQEKSRIEEEIHAVLDELDTKDMASVSDRIRSFSSRSENRLDSTLSDEELLEIFRKEIDRAIEPCAPFFYDFRFDELEVKRMNRVREKGGALALYNRTSDKGVLHVNLSSSENLHVYSIATTIHHEAIPGHHLQRSIRLKLDDLPTFRRFLPFTAYNEGWAMYCEVLGNELGLLDSPEKKLGMLELDLLRTIRLICDIGIHHKKWLRDQAISYMVANTGLTRKVAEREIDRFIVSPGQGCAYKVGQLKMLELRNRMKSELGSYYDIRQFHDVVLRNGAVPLDILDEMVDREIERLIAESQTLVPEPI